MSTWSVTCPVCFNEYDSNSKREADRQWAKMERQLRYERRHAITKEERAALREVINYAANADFVLADLELSDLEEHGVGRPAKQRKLELARKALAKLSLGIRKKSTGGTVGKPHGGRVCAKITPTVH